MIFFFFIWVAIGHSVQYLWVTTFYAAASEPWSGRLRYLVKTLAAGAAIWTVPALVFAPSLFGDVPYRLGLYMLVAAAVNLHHFILDGAIWKLKGRVARVLLGDPGTGTGDGAVARPPRVWGRRAVWAVCAASVVIAVGGESLYQLVWVPAAEADDTPRAALAERWLTFIGHDDPDFHNRRAYDEVRRGDLEAAARRFEDSLALYPTAEAWLGLADVRLREGEAYAALRSAEKSLAIAPSADAWAIVGMLRTRDGDADGALAAYQAALALDPDHLMALRGEGRYWLEQGRRKRARGLLERALKLAPDDEKIRSDLARAQI